MDHFQYADADPKNITIIDNTVGAHTLISPDELNRRFTYHAPDEEKVQRHQDLRDLVWHTAAVVVQSTPPGREQALAITHLEEALFWANAALARPGADG